MKNGAEKKNELLKFIAERINKPRPLKFIFSQAKRRKEFSELTASSFYYNIKLLIGEGKLEITEDRNSHPKRKPIFLIQQKKTDDKNNIVAVA